MGGGRPELLNHHLCHQLCQEERALGVYVEQPIEALFGGIQQVSAILRRDAGVVHEQINPTKFLSRELNQPLAIRRSADIRLADDRADGMTAFRGGYHTIARGLPCRDLVPGKVDDEIVTRFRQLERYAVLMRRIDERPVKLGLYFPLLKGWREWESGG